MSLVDELAKVDELRAELDALRPLPKETEQRVMQKLRLEWNYHSAKIEGGELTFGETKALLLFGITAGQKPLKDHLEMKGHNEAINILLDFAQEKRLLNEFTIRELHQLILGREPFQAEAETADGQRTSRTITPGRYKKEPNHVMTPTGEMFYFARPEETEEKMQKLVEWYRKEHEKNDTHPVLLAAEFHYRFVRIHPFDDGNGRMARLLMNLILMQHGLPPAVIQSDREQKEQYYRVLQAADAGDIEPFVEYIAREVARSLDIMVRAAKGESIEDPDDVYKEIALLNKQLESTDAHNARVARSTDIIRSVCMDVIAPLFERIAGELSLLDKWFDKKVISVSFQGQVVSLSYDTNNSHNSYTWFVRPTKSKKHNFKILELADMTLSRLWEQYPWTSDDPDIGFSYQWEDFKYSNNDKIDIRVGVEIDFERYQLRISGGVEEGQIVKSYRDIFLSEEEIKQFIHLLLRRTLERIKLYMPSENLGGEK